MTKTTKQQALQLTEPDVKKTAVASLKVARGSTSFTAQIADLEVSECCSRIGQLMPEMTLAEFAAQATILKAQFRNNLMPSVRGAMAQTGSSYAVEVVITVTTPGSIYLVAIVTRTA